MNNEGKNLMRILSFGIDYEWNGFLKKKRIPISVVVIYNNNNSSYIEE